MDGDAGALTSKSKPQRTWGQFWSYFALGSVSGLLTGLLMGCTGESFTMARGHVLAWLLRDVTHMRQRS